MEDYPMLRCMSGQGLKAILAATFLFATVPSAHAQEWMQRYGFGSGGKPITSIRQLSDGDFVICTSYEIDMFNDGHVIARISPWGEPLWAKKITDMRDAPKLTVASDDDIYVGLPHGLVGPLRLLRMSPEGDVQWEHVLTVDPSEGWVLATSSDDGLVVASGGDVGSTSQVAVARFDSLGQKLWDVTLSIRECEQATGGCLVSFGDLLAEPNGELLVVAGVASYYGPIGFFLLSLDANGNYLGHRAYETDVPYGLTHVRRTSDDELVFVGSGTVEGTLVVKYDSSDTVVWAKEISEQGSSLALIQDIELTDDDAIVLASLGDSPPHIDPELRKIDSAGNAEWDMVYNCSFPWPSDPTTAFYALEIIEDGRIAAAGECGPSVVAVVDADGYVDNACDTMTVNFTTFDSPFASLPLDLTITVTPDDHSTSSSPIAMEDANVWIELECSGPPSEVSPHGAEQALVFTDEETIIWDEAASSGSQVFNVYRGTVAAVASGDYGACLLSGVSVNSASDSESPLSNECWTYLVSGENDSGEGPVGFDSSGAERANSTPCTP